MQSLANGYQSSCCSRHSGRGLLRSWQPDLGTATECRTKCTGCTAWSKQATTADILVPHSASLPSPVMVHLSAPFMPHKNGTCNNNMLDFFRSTETWQFSWTSWVSCLPGHWQLSKRGKESSRQKCALRRKGQGWALSGKLWNVRGQAWGFCID